VEEYTVSQLSELIKRSIEQNFSEVRLRAEVSSLKVHSSGHLYFCLKDAGAVIDAICWKGVALRQKIRLEDGMEIRCSGNVSTYHPRSKYQLIVAQFELAGAGELLRLLEERRKKLAAEGLFDISRKKQLPTIPRLIGIITSPTGAVLKDMLHRIRQRFPVDVLLWPVLVQGTESASQIEEAVDGMNALPVDQRPDLLVVARGGGSFEDLMPFNEENVVRAVARSHIPIISAVGHETDTTLSDYAADLRAPTPTAAAEFAVPEKIKLQLNLGQIFSRLILLISGDMERRKLFLRSSRILNIQGLMAEKIQLTDHIFDRMLARMKDNFSAKKISLAKMMLQKPTMAKNIDDVFRNMAFSFNRLLENTKNSFTIAANGLESNSYANILRKGFAFVETATFRPVTSAKEAAKHSNFRLTFADGNINVRRDDIQGDLF
jgi:exodeoxyribonuclease VII large subunit